MLQIYLPPFNGLNNYCHRVVIYTPTVNLKKSWVGAWSQYKETHSCGKCKSNVMEFSSRKTSTSKHQPFPSSTRRKIKNLLFIVWWAAWSSPKMTCSILGPFFGPRGYVTHYWCIYPKRPWLSVNLYVSRERPPNNPRYWSPRSQGPDIGLCLTNTPPHGHYCGQTDLDTQQRHWLYTQDRLQDNQ